MMFTLASFQKQCGIFHTIQFWPFESILADSRGTFWPSYCMICGMKTVIQRVTEASVTIEGQVHGSIGTGFMILVGISDQDSEETVRKMADKILKLRIFEDEAGKMNLALAAVNGAVLSISQFTLYANCAKGNRPSFDGAGKPEHAKALYLYFNEYLRSLGVHVEEGIFAADMKVELLNDGPITICLDSEDLK